MKKPMKLFYHFLQDFAIDFRPNLHFWRNNLNRSNRLILPSKFKPDQLIHSVPSHIAKPSYYFKDELPHPMYGQADIQKPSVIKAMRATSRLAANILRRCSEELKPGVSTGELNAFAHKAIIMANAYPSALRYQQYPKSISTSINNVICQGIPDRREIENGDLVKVDLAVFANGVHGNCAKTFLIGDVSEKDKFLCDVAELCLDEAIRICGPGVPFSEIGNTIEDIVDEHGLRLVSERMGHGIGTYLHGPPGILHCANDDTDVMAPGMTFTIEPTLVSGSPLSVLYTDGWTTVTKNHAQCAYFRHTVLITDNGCEILTLPDGTV